MLNIRIATENDKNEWNDFVFKNNGSIFLKFEWRSILQESYSYEPFYLMAYENDILVGVLPGFLTGKLNQKRIVSIPFADSAGPLGINQDIEIAMIDYLLKFAKEKNKNIFSITTKNNYSSLPNDLFCSSPFTEFSLNLETPYETFFQKKYEYSIRKQINKTKKNNYLYSTLDFSSDFKKIYKLYCENIYKYDGIPFDINFFKIVNKHLSTDSKIYCAKDKNKIISFIWAFTWNKKMRLWIFGYDKNYIKSGITCGIYDYAIKDAYKLTLNNVYFGSNPKESGVVTFKEKWGGDKKDIYLIMNSHYSNSKKSILQKSTASILRLLPSFLSQKLTKIIFIYY